MKYILSQERIHHPEWDMNITLEELFTYNRYCKFDRNNGKGYGGIIYLSHPDESIINNIGIILLEQGFYYYSDGIPFDNLEIELLEDVLKECLEKRKQYEEVNYNDK